MKGSYHIRISNRAVSYEFTLIRNITILQGDSATGKTTLVDMVREYVLQGADSAITLSCSRPCAVLEGNTWERQLKSLDEGTIVFIDEGNRFVASKEFAAAVQSSGHYYVIVTREALYTLPYSVTEIYGIRSSGKYNSLHPVYHEFYRIYGKDTVNKDSRISRNPCVILTEDSNSGYQFFSGVCSDTTTCISAGGNSNILPEVKKEIAQNALTDILVVADGAAFGAYMQQIDIFMKKHSRVTLYLPESFEWLILQSGLIDGKQVADIVKHPENYIECNEYFSWEQFFTALLIQETKETFLQYSKSKLNAVYLQEREKIAILSTLPERVKDLCVDEEP